MQHDYEKQALLGTVPPPRDPFTFEETQFVGALPTVISSVF